MEAATLPTETETLALVSRIQQGDREAWEELYRKYHDELLFSIRAQLGPRLRNFLQSEDVFQSVALEAFAALPKFAPRHKGSLRHFLNRLVLNKIRDRADTVKAKKRAGGVPLTDSLLVTLSDRKATAEPAYFHSDRYEKLEKGLGQLPPDMKEVILLRKIDGLSSKETAEKLGKSDEATRKLFSRAMARLASSMIGGQAE